MGDLVRVAGGVAEGDDPPEAVECPQLWLEPGPAHVKDDVDLLAAVRLDDRLGQVVGPGVGGGVGAEALGRRSLLIARGEGDHLGAGALGQLHGEAPGAARGGLDHDRLTLADVGAVVKQRVGGEALQQQPRGLLVVDLIGEGNEERLGDGDLLGVAPSSDQRRNALAVGRRAADLAAGNHRQGLLGQVVVVGRVRVGEVDPRAGDIDQDLAIGRLGVGQIDMLHDLGPAEFLDLNSLHRAECTDRPVSTYVPNRRRINCVRFRPHPVRGAGADAGRIRGPFLARGELLHRRQGGRPGGRRLRRRAARGARGPRRHHRRHRARRGRRDLLLAGPLRVRHERRPHRRHAAQRLRRVRPQALGRLAAVGDAVPRQHPARPAAPRARGLHRRDVRRARLDEPLDRDRARLAGRRDRRDRLRAAERRRDPHADRRAPARQGGPRG